MTNKQNNNKEMATAIFDLAVSINHNTRLANELVTRQESFTKAHKQANEFLADLPENIGSTKCVNIAGNSIARNVPGVEQLLDCVDELFNAYMEAACAAEKLPEMKAQYERLANYAMSGTFVSAYEYEQLINQMEARYEQLAGVTSGEAEAVPVDIPTPYGKYSEYIDDIDEDEDDEDEDDEDEDDEDNIAADDIYESWLRYHSASHEDNNNDHVNTGDLTGMVTAEENIGVDVGVGDIDIVEVGDIVKVGDININIGGSINININDNKVNDD